tara:strand:+ start:205 stop:507 length:303 start_codon:yes stop_codon:yes gene_type:complete
MDGLLFGLIDNGVLLICIYTGISIDMWISDRAGRGLLGAVLGGTIGNLISDFCGALIDPTMRGALLGITIGCLIRIALIPVIEKIRNRDEAELWEDVEDE